MRMSKIITDKIAPQKPGLLSVSDRAMAAKTMAAAPQINSRAEDHPAQIEVDKANNKYAGDSYKNRHRPNGIAW